MNGAAWAGRLGIVIAIIIIEKASPALAWFLVLAAALGWIGYALWYGGLLSAATKKSISAFLPGQAKTAPVDGLTVIDDKVLADRLKERIIGQDDTIDQIATQIRRRVAARREDKPIAVFCFAGPPGVGKTELAKVLTDVLYDSTAHLHFFSMAELGKDRNAPIILFGHPGSLGEGTLTSALLREPRAVVLLDEIEKAHPDAMKRFLSAWNDGFITDQKTGAKSSTTEAIFILTTNANHREIAELTESHEGPPDELNRKVKDMLSVGESALAAEVLSRVDTVFAFRPMKGIDIAYVVALQIERLARSYGLEIADGGIAKELLIDAVERLERLGTKGGVRDIAREIEQGVADGLIDAKASGAKVVRFDVDGTKVKVVPVKEGGKAADVKRAKTAKTEA